MNACHTRTTGIRLAAMGRVIAFAARVSAADSARQCQTIRVAGVWRSVVFCVPLMGSVREFPCVCRPAGKGPSRPGGVDDARRRRLDRPRAFARQLVRQPTGGPDARRAEQQARHRRGDVPSSRQPGKYRIWVRYLDMVNYRSKSGFLFVGQLRRQAGCQKDFDNTETSPRSTPEGAKKWGDGFARWIWDFVEFDAAAGELRSRSRRSIWPPFTAAPARWTCCC